MDRKKLIEKFEKLLDTTETLRQQCPWDREQTPESLRPLTIEETYELAQAIIKNDTTDQKKELGDVLLHIIFYSQIAEERNQFDLNDVIDSLTEKLIFRHPHIFSDYKATTAEEVSKMWEEVKLKEKGGNKTVLGGIPDSLPALIKAFRLQDKAKGVGFDWIDANGAWQKFNEEISEFSHEIDKQDKENAEKEFGDVLFSLINVGRMYGINPENALEKTNLKFKNRFNYIEEQAKKEGKKIKEMTLEQMDALWDKAKENGL